MLRNREQNNLVLLHPLCSSLQQLWVQPLALLVSYSPGFRHPVLIGRDLNPYKILLSKLFKEKSATAQLVKALIYYNKRIDNGS